MPKTKEALAKAGAKSKLIAEHRRSAADTGSTEVQVALLTAQIRSLTEHLKMHSKDFAARRGLLVQVGRRSSLLKYLNNTDRERYLELIQKLDIRAK
jgi:small subunit ribosomal protein S15